MIFEHLIEVNTVQESTIKPLTRSQLWQGLVCRAEQPTLFMPHLDACDITARSGAEVRRTLTYGELVIDDKVTYFPEEGIRYDVTAQKDFPDSVMTMTIEEPDTGGLFVRFLYEDSSPERGVDAMYNDFRRSAYREADIDTIHIIRRLADQGDLG